MILLYWQTTDILPDKSNGQFRGTNWQVHPAYIFVQRKDTIRLRILL